MMNTKIQDNVEGLYDKVRGDNDDFIDERAFERKVEELVELHYIETSIYDDSVLYSARPGLKWPDFVDIDDPVKKNILLLLIDNPTTFFVLLNTQKGKMRINALEVKKWSEDTTKRVVSFIVVANDSTLADQSAEGINNTIGALNVQLIRLSSHSKDNYDSIKTIIDAYEFNDDYKMPVIVLLANNKQIEKIIKLIQHIHNKIINRGSLLRYGIIWDEADQIYPQFRNKEFQIGPERVAIKNYIINNNVGLYRLGFTTASDGDLLDEEYPECANAYLYPIIIDPEDARNYRALHHPEAVTHRVQFTTKHTNNSYAKEVISNNLPYFKSTYALPSGEIYHKKIIINSNAKTSDMGEFANWCNGQGINALIFNGYGGASVKARIIGKPLKTFKTKGKKFNEVLFYIYKKLHLNDKPLVIIGRRKVDRGLGFHYCPRVNDAITMDGPEGVLITNNREGLIWTDMILGKIDDKNTAVQKGGRLAGIIGNSPQYPGEIHYWTDEHTEDLIRRHNTIVDTANTYTGCSVLQAVRHAQDATPIRKVNHRVKLNAFLVYEDEADVQAVCEILGRNFIKRPTRDDGFQYASYKNKPTSKGSLLEAIESVPGAWGGLPDEEDVDVDLSLGAEKNIKLEKDDKTTGFLVRKLENNKYVVNINGQESEIDRKDFKLIRYTVFFPGYKNLDDPASLHYVVVIRPMDEAKLPEIEARFPSIKIPQEGDF
jgi:hypothetical protein